MFINFTEDQSHYTGESKYQSVMRKKVIAREQKMMKGARYNKSMANFHKIE